MASRREKFREAMARLAPAGSPSDAIDRGLYINRPGRSAVAVVSTRLELAPTSSYLLVGGIGSGKTTELLMTAKTLSDLDDVHAFYIDVSAVHDIKKMPAGTLIAVAGVELAKRISGLEWDRSTELAREKLLEIARGYRHYMRDDYPASIRTSEEPGEPPKWVEVPAAIQPPDPDARRLSELVHERSKLVERVSAPLRRTRPHLVLVFDSLDRKADLDDFKDIILEDVEALQRIGIGVVLTAPLAIIHGESRIMVQQYFQDRTFLQTAVDVHSDAAGIDFLTRIIHARAPNDMIPEDACRALAKASGGVLRDMIALAHSAVQEAYADGGNHVEVKHVERVSKTFGRNLLIGLTGEQHQTLKALRHNNYFSGATPSDSYLLATQRIVVYSTADDEIRYAVHPTMEEVHPTTTTLLTMELPRIGSGELASQIRSECGTGTWICVIAPEERLVTITNEIAHTLAVGNSKSVLIQLDRSVKPLVDAPHDVLVLVTGFGTLSDDEWQHLDQLRSTRLIRNQPALLIMSPASMQHLMRIAPNMASFLGGQFFHFHEHAERLTDEEKANRLADLRFQFGKTDDEVIELARAGAPMDEPAYAEWLVLLNRGDLLQR